MTTDIPAGRHAVTAAAALGTWVLALAATGLVLEPTPTVIAFGPRGHVVLAAGAAGAAVVGLGHLATQVRAVRPGLARALYAGGAWLVLPVPDSLCIAP